MVPNRDYLLQLVREKDWSGSELGRRMGISRTEANRLLNGSRVGGKKVIAGLMKAFPEEPLNRLFLLPTVEPKNNKGKATSK
ncbi:helix-turn-helix transcriptional regulator [Peptococcaceae bacterium 1198_IL3148]